ncbi:MAG: hypothetical protein U1E02_22540, partial [Hydrogenophaga sp.]|nr:hypothetical protein [Hydrogenophaga sp.]
MLQANTFKLIARAKVPEPCTCQNLNAHEKSSIIKSQKKQTENNFFTKKKKARLLKNDILYPHCLLLSSFLQYKEIPGITE